MKFIPFFLIVLLPFLVFSQEEKIEFETKIKKYKQEFNIDCLPEKATNNKGDGNKKLYGTRNFRTILHGIAYRGGGNNYFHKTNKRNNKNPLPQDGLDNLLNIGFSNVVYLYKTNWETAPPFVTNSIDTLNYYQLSGNSLGSRDSIISMVYETIQNKTKGPAYLHCWNGWHQSGYISAILLKQFCGFSTLTSLHYWEDCADSWSKGYERIKLAIMNFEPIEKYKINQELSDLICPCYEDTRKNDTIKYISQTMEVLNLNLPFPTGDFSLTPSVTTFLDEYGTMLKNNPHIFIEIEGHSDHVGDENKNLVLSKERAKQVYNYLIKNDVDSTNLTYNGYGEEAPLIDCTDRHNRCSEKEIAKNRRVTFRTTSISFNINFEKSSYVIPPEDKKQLSEIFNFLSSDKKLKVEIQGHADSGTGSNLYNKNISEMRAKSVYDFLKDQDFDVKNLSYKGYGSEKERFYDSRDRRIEFKIIPQNRKILKPNNKKYHKIKSGDTLSKLAMKYYGDYNKLEKIVRLNKKKLKKGSKSVLQIGQKIRIY